MITGIVAISENFAIGKGGKLPWHYPADLKFFKKTTTGHAVVMGANTWRSLRAPLPDRLNVVLSRSDALVLPPDVIKLGSKEEVIDLAKLLTKDLFIIGGAKTYAEFADVIEKWVVTGVPLTIADADTFMPSDFLNDFELRDSEDLGDGLSVRILYRR